jgi:hypothetical protein
MQASAFRAVYSFHCFRAVSKEKTVPAAGKYLFFKFPGVQGAREIPRPSGKIPLWRLAGFGKESKPLYFRQNTPVRVTVCLCGPLRSAHNKYRACPLAPRPLGL